VELAAAFPPQLRPDVEVVAQRLTELAPPQRQFVVALSTGSVAIPGRVYIELSNDRDLSESQHLILSCLLTRHSDGFVRQKRLERIVTDSHEWVCPYVLALVGEYVVEIVELIRANVDSLDRDLYRNFVARNPAFLKLTMQRAASYWDCYYRARFKRFADYPATTIFRSLDL
jgi:hypothetical protein